MKCIKSYLAQQRYDDQNKWKGSHQKQEKEEMQDQQETEQEPKQKIHLYSTNFTL